LQSGFSPSLRAGRQKDVQGEKYELCVFQHQEQELDVQNGMRDIM
jgi:ribosome modulation factor